MKRTIQCSPKKWLAVAREEADSAGLDLAKVLSGSRERKYLLVRWRAWKRLMDLGCSSVQIGLASGYNHTTVLYACNDDMRFRYITRHRSIVAASRAPKQMEAA